MDDQKIQVPVSPKRIACMHGVSSDRIIMLGKGDRLALTMEPTPWAYRLYPEIRNVPIAKPPFTLASCCCATRVTSCSCRLQLNS